MTASADDRVLFDVDPDNRIATITLNNPKQRNSYDAADARSRRATAWTRSPKTTTSPWCCCAEPTGCSAPART